MTFDELRTQHCKPRKGAEQALPSDGVGAHLALLPGWQLVADGTAIRKEYGFKDYYRTMAFVNALAFVAHAEDHHPDLEVGYARCVVTYSTHDVGGLSLNDFICAARAEALSTGV
jgi:4a-hydroxytetrahydrobiopterin dehydratase